jgi:predicted exporter
VLLIFWLLLMLLAGWWAVARVEVHSNLSLFLPPGKTDIERFLLSELHQGAAARLLLLAIEGGTEKQRIECSRQLTEKLRQNPQFQRVENGSFSFDMDEPPLFHFRYLLSPEINDTHFSVENLKVSLQERLWELHNPIYSPFRNLLPADPTAVYQGLLSLWRNQSTSVTTQGVWSSQDATRMLMLAETQAGSMELNRQQQAVAVINSTFHTINSSGELKLIISGPGAFGVESRELIRNETQWLSLFASIAIMLLLLTAYRSWRYLVVVIIPLSSALLSGALAVDLLFGELHGLTLAFGVTLLGVTIDYPIHLFSHLHMGKAPIRAMQGIWKTLWLGVMTTCIGYMALVSTQFTGLQQLGVFMVTGLLSASLTSRYVLPMLMRQQEPKQQLGPLKYLLRLRLQRRSSRLFLIILALLPLLPIVLVSGPAWQDDLATLSPLPRSSISLDREIRGQLNVAEVNQLIILHAGDLESVLQAAERLQPRLQKLVESGVLGGYQNAARYLPSRRTQQQRQSLLPTAKQMQSRLAQALEGLPFRKDVFKPFLAELEKSRQFAPLTMSDMAGTPQGKHLNELLKKADDGWLLLIPLSQVTDEMALSSALAQGGTSASYVSLRDESNRLVMGLREEIGYRVAWGLVLMFMALALGLRSPKQATQALFPVLLALSTSLGLLHLLGEPITLFHIIALMLVLGIGLDYSLFFNRREVSDRESYYTLQALFICALSTAIVFSLLGFSSIPVLHAIGQTVTLGVVASFALTLLLRGDKSI